MPALRPARYTGYSAAERELTGSGTGFSAVRDLEELPRRLVAVGGGPVGCELGQGFARLGSQVVLVARSGLLPKEDRDAAALVRESPLADGVRVVENAGADRVGVHEDGSSTVHVSDGQAFAADVVLVAAARTARTQGLGLDAVGVTEASGKGHTTSTVRHEDTDRAVTERRTGGMTRVVVDRRGRILGGTVVGPRAGESLAELTLAVEQRLRTRDPAGITHPCPTYDDAVWNAAIAHARSGLDSPVAGAAVQAPLRLDRWRVQRSNR